MKWLFSLPIFRALESRRASKRRKALILLLIAPLLIVTLVLVFSPKLVGKWRSRYLSDKSASYQKVGKFQEACSMAESAYLLDTNNLEALRLAVDCNTKLNLRKAALLGRLLYDHESATLEDQRKAVKLFFLAGDSITTARYTEELSEKHPEDVDLKILLAQAKFLTGNKDSAIQLMRESAKAAPTSRNSLALAEMLLFDKDAALRLEGQKLVFRVLNEDKTQSKDALNLLSRAPLDPTMIASIPEMVQLLPDIEKSGSDEKLDVYTLEIRKDKTRRDEIVKKAIAEFKDKDLDALLEWVLRMGRPELVQELVTAKDAHLTLSRYKSYLSSLLRTGKLREAEEFLGEHHPGLPAIQVLAMQAKLAEFRKNTKDASVLWSKALDEALAESTGQRLLYLGELCVNAGNARLAVRAFTAAYERPLGAQVGTKRVERVMIIASRLLMEEETRRLAKVLHDREPSNSDYTNNYAYYCILQNNRVSESIQELKDLVSIFPDKIGYRTSLALGYLRAGSANAALKLLDESSVNWSKSAPQDLIVYLAALKATGQMDKAKGLKTGLNLKVLLPSERALVDKL